MQNRINYYVIECKWLADVKGEKALREVAKAERETAREAGDNVSVSEILSGLRIARRTLRNS